MESRICRGSGECQREGGRFLGFGLGFGWSGFSIANVAILVGNREESSSREWRFRGILG